MVFPSIDDVPPEILSEIFTIYCTPDGWPNPKGPITLGLVCKHWRLITLSSLALWTYINVHGVSTHLETQVSAINRWLARSGNLPCGLGLGLWTDEHHPTPCITSRVLQPISNRITRLDLTLDLEEFLGCIDVLLRGFPNLLYLHLSIMGEDEEEAVEVELFALSSSAYPRLEKVIFGFRLLRALGGQGLVRALPTSLKSFNQSFGLQPATILDVLSKCLHLEAMIVDVYFPSQGWVVPLPESMKFQFVHQNIRTLDLAFDGFGLQPLFRAVQFPRLTSLRLARAEDSAAILRIIAGARPPLESLELRCVPVTLEELLHFCSRVPTVACLLVHDLTYVSNYKPLISSLTLFPGATEGYLPNLKCFKIAGCRLAETSLSNEDLVGFVQSRWRIEVNGFSRLEKVAFLNRRRWGGECLERLVAMQEQGLDATLW